MARGATDKLNQTYNTAQNVTGEEVNPAIQAATQMIQNPGYTAAEKGSITGATMGGLGGAFDAARQNAANRVARTRNSAGYSSLADDLARGQGQEAGLLGARNQEQFANARMANQQQGVEDLSGLYRTSGGILNDTLDQLNKQKTTGFGLNLGKLGSFGANVSG